MWFLVLISAFYASNMSLTNVYAVDKEDVASVFSSLENGKDYVFIKEVTGGEARKLVEGKNPVLSRDGKRVIFFREMRSGDADSTSMKAIKTINTDGSDEKTLLDSEEFERGLGLSHIFFGVFTSFWETPDESLIYFSWEFGMEGNVLCVMRADGSEVQRIETHAGLSTRSWPSFLSPDSARILISKYADGSAALYVARLDGSPAVLLSQRTEVGAWSPDGSRIAFTWGERAGIIVVNNDGTNRVNLFDAANRKTWPEGVSISAGSFAVAFDPEKEEIWPGVITWSIDGSKLRFVNQASPNREKPDIYEIDTEGNHLSRATELFPIYSLYNDETSSAVGVNTWGRIKASIKHW